MCYSATASLSTYFIGSVGALRLYTLGYTPEALFYAVVVQMQLIEYILWNLQQCNNRRVLTHNDTWTNIGTTVNHLEPVALWVAITWASCHVLPWYIHLFMIVFVAWTLCYTFETMRIPHCTRASRESGHYLYWHWNFETGHVLYYVAFLISLVLLSLYGLSHGIAHSVVVVTTFLISLALYGRHKSAGAMWCVFAAFVPYILPALYKMM